MLSCLSNFVLAGLPWLPCPIGPVLTIFSLTPCHGCPAALFCHGCPVVAVLRLLARTILSCMSFSESSPGCTRNPILVVLQQFLCHKGSALALFALSCKQSCAHHAVIAVLSEQQPCPGCSAICCPGLALVLSTTPVLCLLPFSPALPVLPQLSFTGCPAVPFCYSCHITAVTE